METGDSPALLRGNVPRRSAGTAGYFPAAGNSGNLPAGSPRPRPSPSVPYPVPSKETPITPLPQRHVVLPPYRREYGRNDAGSSPPERPCSSATRGGIVFRMQVADHQPRLCPPAAPPSAQWIPPAPPPSADPPYPPHRARDKKAGSFRCRRCFFSSPPTAKTLAGKRLALHHRQGRIAPGTGGSYRADPGKNPSPSRPPAAGSSCYGIKSHRRTRITPFRASPSVRQMGAPETLPLVITKQSVVMVRPSL